jgi:hypothetical protein
MSRYPKLIESCVHESKLDEIISRANTQDDIPHRALTPEENARADRIAKEFNISPANPHEPKRTVSHVNLLDGDGTYSLELCLKLKPNQKIKRRHVVGVYWMPMPFLLGWRSKDELFELINFEKFPADYIPHWKKAGLWPVLQ